MADNHSVTIPAHYNIYTSSNNRNLKIDFSTPSSGVTSQTGFLILIPGFGAQLDSNVYKKMRETFADEYNLVTIQCAYFGSEFMQSSDSFKLHNSISELAPYFSKEDLDEIEKSPTNLLTSIPNEHLTITVTADLNESEDNFNDMGFMQAIDNLTSIEAIKLILKENNLEFNANKVIGYGHSHGAYLLHLSNRLAPHVFSSIIDNSAWIEPVYLSHNRQLSKQGQTRQDKTRQDKTRQDKTRV